MPEKLTRYCKDCPSIDWCLDAFNRFWYEKSRNGLGCNTPLPPPPKNFRPKPKKRPAVVQQPELLLKSAEPPPLTDDDL